MAMEEEKKSTRGFASMDAKKRAEIASKGGKAAHASGKAHEFTHEEAVKAGKRGGIAPHVSRGKPRQAGAQLCKLDVDHHGPCARLQGHRGTCKPSEV